MSDENKTAIPAGTDDVTEDIIPERKIKAGEAVHTTAAAGDDLYIPPEDAAPAAPQSDRRFIKTGDAEYVSVRARAPEEADATEVSRYPDRLDAVPAQSAAPADAVRTDTYDTIHAPEAGTRMIDASVYEEQLTMDGMPDDLPSDDEPTKEADFASLSGGNTDTDEDADGDPTKHFEIQGSRLREIADTAADGVRRNPDQMMMEGFDEIGKKTEDEIEADAELQEKLRQSRADRVKNFRFWNKAPGEEVSDAADARFDHEKKQHDLPAFAAKFSARFQHLATPFLPVKCEEYADTGSRKKVFDTIKNARTRVFIGTVLLAAFGLILLITDLAAKITAGNNGGFFTVMGGSVNALVVFNLIFLLLSVGIMLPDLKNGVITVLKLRPKTEALMLLMFISALVQTVAAFFTQLKIASDFQLMAPAAVLVCVPYLLSKVFYYDNARQVFKTVSGKSEKSYLRRVTDPELKARLGCTDDTNTVYAGRTRAVSGFPASVQESPRDEMPHTRVAAVIGGVALVTALLTLIIKKSFLCSLTTLTLCLALSLPVCCLLAGSYFLSRANGKLSIRSSFIQSFKDAKAFSVIDTIACDAAQIFDAEITNCLTAKTVNEKQVRFAAAAVAAGTDSMLHKVFAGDIEKYEDRLPPAKNTVYEDKMGVSSYVGGCTVLLGNHDLLVNHNVQLPDEDVVMRFLAEDEKPLYLAMEGRFTALFAVRYTVAEEVSRGITELVNGGASLLLATTDPNINDASAEALLGLSENSVRMIGSAAARKLAAAQSAVTDAEDAGVVFTDSFLSLSRTAAQAVTLDSVNTVSTAICLAGSFVSLLVGLLLSVTGAFASASAVTVLVLQAIWIGCCLLSPLFTSSVIKLVKKGAGLAKKLTQKKPAAPAETAEPVLPAPEEYEEPAPIFEETPRETEEAAPVKETPAAAEEAPYVPPTLDPDAIAASEPKPAETDVPDDVLESLRTFAPKEAPAAPKAPEEAPAKFIASEELRQSFSSVDDYIASLTGDATPAKEETEDGFSLYGENAPRTHQKNASEIESAYEQSKKEESDVRRAFTAPEAPKAPSFDAPAEEADDGGEPLDTSDVSVYNDDLFRRFETDDDVFAGLHDDDDNGGEGYVF